MVGGDGVSYVRTQGENTTLYLSNFLCFLSCFHVMNHNVPLHRQQSQDPSAGNLCVRTSGAGAERHGGVQEAGDPGPAASC